MNNGKMVDHRTDFKRGATKIFTFAAAHLLTGHAGLCQNLHGHNYTVEVTFSPSNNLAGDLIMDGAAAGMVCDFKEIKELCNKHVFDAYDHAFVYNSEVVESGLFSGSPEVLVSRAVMHSGLKTVSFPGRPTAEKMAEVFYMQINEMLETKAPHCCCSAIKVWETDSSFAEYGRIR